MTYRVAVVVEWDGLGASDTVQAVSSAETFIRNCLAGTGGMNKTENFRVRVIEIREETK